jgi:hypothetical protein
MALTTKDLADLNAFLRRTNSNAKVEQWMRWFQLAVGLGMIGLGVWCFLLVEREASLTFSHTPITAVGLATDVIMTRSITMFYTNAVLIMSFGAWCLGVTLARWNRPKNQRLLVKLARTYLDEQQSPPDGPA